MREGKGFLLVYDIREPSSFDEISFLRDKILRAKDVSTVPLVIAGNKCDLRDHNDGSQVKKETGTDLAKKWDCPFFETSAKDKINNEECFFAVVREIRKQEKKQNSAEKKKKKKC